MGDQLLDRRSNHQSVHALDRLSPPPAARHLIATMEANQIGGGTLRLQRFIRPLAVTTLLIVGCTSLLLQPGQANAASATATDIANPDAYTCSQSGYIDFERLRDGASLSAGAINGVKFTTTNGFTWQVCDFATGNYNGKYPNGGYTSQGTHWAWLGPDQGAGRIDFVNGPASVFSLLTSDNLSRVQVDAYRADNTLLATAGPSSINYNTGHMDELKITRDTSDIAYVVVHDSGNFFLVDSICTNAPGVPRGSLIDFKQNKNADGKPTSWAPDILYDSPACRPNVPMGSYGCAITALTDIVASYGLQKLPNDKPVDPGSVNHYLGANPGTHTRCLLYWANAGKVLGYTVTPYMAGSVSLSKRLAVLDKALEGNNLIIAAIKNRSHYVVFYQKAAQKAPDGSPDYLIADPARQFPLPGDNSGKTLYQAYHQTINQIAGTFDVIVVENKAPVPGRSWAIAAHSPVEMLVTDPNGSQTGFNPATGSTVLDIPDSSYGLQSGLEDDDGVKPPVPGALFFEQANLEAGTYKLEVIGTGTGPYHLDFAVANGPMDTSVQTVAGNAVAGQTDTYTISTAAGQPISIERQIPIDIRPGSDPAPINVGSRGVVPVAILSSPTFDARTVDFQTLTFGPAQAPRSTSRLALRTSTGMGLPIWSSTSTTRKQESPEAPLRHVSPES